jgi:type IX secretion system PorP/SprF family membrane protein
MKTMRKILALLAFGMMANLATAQQIPLYSNYFFTPYIYNPAMSGSTGVTEATFLHRRQWTGIQGSPETSALAVNGSLNEEKVGWSIYGFSDRTDILSRLGIYGNYAYHVKITDDISLSGGIGAGYLNQNIDQSAVRARDLGDVFSVVAPNRGSFDINIGLKLAVQNFTLGFAAPQLLSQNVVYATNPSDINYNMIRHYVATAQYDFKFAGEKQVLSPILMVRTAESVPAQIDAGLLYNMKEYGFLGAMFRSNYGITINAGVNLSETLTLGYAYDFSTNTYGSNFGTSHEFMLTYRFGSNKDNERMQNELKRLKLNQRRQKDELEETVDEKLEEFKDSYKDDIQKALEEEKKKMVEELEKLRKQAEEQGNRNNNNNSNNNNQGGQQNNQSNNPNNNMPNNQAANNNNNNDNAGSTNNMNQPANNAGINYPQENLPANVNPGSPGYYVTAGVFGQQANAQRLANKLATQNIDARIFQDPGNSFYYVYLLKFNSYGEADQAKASQLNGRFNGDLWIKILK